MKAIKVLLVDDEEDILDLLQYALEQEGFEIYKAKDGLTALDLAKSYGVRYRPGN